SERTQAMQKLELDVFGRKMLAERGRNGWRLYFPGGEGKRRPVPDVVVPEDIAGTGELVQFLDDHFHEYATKENPAVRVIRTGA
ncbi:MAG TPA: hypothetical protein VF254_09830, partial [Gammaproteobacteria bacterium]